MTGRILIGVCFTSFVALIAGGCYQPPDINKVGGAILVYEIDRQSPHGAVDGPINFEPLCESVVERLNPLVYGVQARPHDEDSIEIILPGVAPRDLPAIKNRMARNGMLEFLIVADYEIHADMVEQAFESDEEEVATDEGIVGRWTDLRVDKSQEGPPEFAGVSATDVLRGRREDGEFELLDLPAEQLESVRVGEESLYTASRKLGYKDVQLLLCVDPNPARNITSRHLRYASPSVDNYGNPSLHASMTRQGASLLQRVTSLHQPDTSTDPPHYYRMAIVMDGVVVSAPRLLSVISDQLQITGNFTKEEIEELAYIFRFSRLALPLKPQPVSEKIIPPKK